MKLVELLNSIEPEQEIEIRENLQKENAGVERFIDGGSCEELLYKYDWDTGTNKIKNTDEVRYLFARNDYLYIIIDRVQ